MARVLPPKIVEDVLEVEAELTDKQRLARFGFIRVLCPVCQAELYIVAPKEWDRESPYPVNCGGCGCGWSLQ